MGFLIDCPNCGLREYTEFAFETEERPDPFREPSTGMALWARVNVAGVQREAWFHQLGCRRWLMVERDTQTNSVRAVV
jgi:heterotetrameric sarcosine oxidase delta subunit